MTRSIDRSDRRSAGHERAWTTAVVVSTGAGLIAAVSELGVKGFVWVATLMCALGVVVVVVMRDVTDRRTGGVRSALRFGLAATASLGVIAAFGLLGIVWAGGLVASSPAVMSRVRSRASRSAVSAAETVPLDDRLPVRAPAREMDLEKLVGSLRDLNDLKNLDDDAVCLAWRRSFVLLQQAQRAPARLVLVQHRQRILDEIERRDPTGLLRWLESNPRAAGNPLPFLSDTSMRSRAVSDSAAHGHTPPDEPGEGTFGAR